MRIVVISFIIMFLNTNFSYSDNFNDTFRVNKQSPAYRLGWNLGWAEKCSYSGYYNKFWKLYKKILATNNPKFKGVKQGWSRMSGVDEASGCSESKLKQILNSTENLLNNSDTK